MVSVKRLVEDQSCQTTAVTDDLLSIGLWVLLWDAHLHLDEQETVAVNVFSSLAPVKQSRPHWLRSLATSCQLSSGWTESRHSVIVPADRRATSPPVKSAHFTKMSTSAFIPDILALYLERDARF